MVSRAHDAIGRVETVLFASFPPGVAVRCCGDDTPEPSLYPSERDATARAVPKRQLEFARGRGCARDALAQLGCAPGPIPVASDRAPIWPDGFVGSITHCVGLVAAVVGRGDAFRALAVDAEPREPLDADLTTIICTPIEIEDTAGLREFDPGIWHRLIFGAKECVHKCVAPLTGEMLDFHDVRIDIDAEALTFRVVAIADRARGLDPLRAIRGRFVACEDWLLTAAWIDLD